MQVVDAARQQSGGVRLLRLHRAAEPVQGEGGGEDPLDDVVVQVAGDAVAVGLHLEPPFPLLGTGQLQDDGGLRGERGEQVQVVGGKRLAAGRPQHRQHPPARGVAHRGDHSRAERGGELDDRGRAPTDDGHRADVLHDPGVAGLVERSDVGPGQGQPHALVVVGALTDGGDDRQRPGVADARCEHAGHVGSGEGQNLGGDRPQHVVGIGSRQQRRGHLGGGLPPTAAGLGALGQAGVLDRQPGHGGQRLRDLDVGIGEGVGGALLGEVEVAEDRVAHPDRDAQEGAHLGVLGREPDRFRVLTEVVEAQQRRLRHEQPEDAVPGRQPADPLAVLRIHADDHEPVQPPAVRRQHSQGPVSGVHVPDCRLHDVVQRRLEPAAGRGGPEGSGQHRGDAAVAVSGDGDHGVGRGHGPTVGGLAGIGKRSRSTDRGSVDGRPQAPRASRRLGCLGTA